jgi:hypothetical protein
MDVIGWNSGVKQRGGTLEAFPLKREIREAPASSSEAIVKVSIGTFVRSSFETRFGSDVAKSLREACIHYTRRLRSGRKPRAAPSLYRALEAGNAPAQVVEFALHERIRGQLEEEALRQQVSMDELLRHAALVYLADLDATPAPA